MKIGLIDVDSHNFPNLALMKISAYHKEKGHKVEFADLFSVYDLVYQSKVFDFTDDYNYFIRASEIKKGGTGYNLENKLNFQIENHYPDYDLYNIKNCAYGFLTRGCPRDCSFCIVTEKEGKCSKKVADLSQFWRGQKNIKLLDPNLLACKDHIELLKQLLNSKAYVDFTQGIDARLLTDENIDIIKQIKIKTLHFAWDFMKYRDEIIKNLEKFKKITQLGYRKLKVYVLTNYNTNFEEDLYRVYKLKEIGYDPYIMIFEKWKCDKKYKKLQRWVNNKIIFRSVEKFEDYKN